MTRNDESMGCSHEMTLDARSFTQLAGILRHQRRELEDLEMPSSSSDRAVFRATLALEQAEAELRNLALAIVEASGRDDEPDEDEEAPQDDARFDAPSFTESLTLPDSEPLPLPQVAPPVAKKRGRPKKKAGR